MLAVMDYPALSDEKIAVAIISMAGYKTETAYSLTNVLMKSHGVRDVLKYNGIMEGEQWYQSDHMIFVQNGRPAIAVASENIAELMSTIAHTPKDTSDMVDCEKIVEAAYSLQDLVKNFRS